MGGVLRAEGPWEPGTTTLVSVEGDIHLSYGGVYVVAKGMRTNVSLAVPGMRVRLKWHTKDEPSGEGMIVAVEDIDHPYGPKCHVLWSSRPRALYMAPSGPFAREYQGTFHEDEHT